MITRVARRLFGAALCLAPLLGRAQAPEQIQALIKEGIALYDEGRLNQAAAKYQEALKLDPASTYAKTELALTYEGLDRHADAAALCKEVLAAPGYRAEPSIYVTYGNALDGLKQPREAVKTYEQGLKKFPASNQLYFNLGIALYGQHKAAEAVEALQQAVRLNPRHASAHLFLGLVTAETGNRVPAILELSRYLVLEPRGERARHYLPRLDQLLRGGAEKTGDNSVTLNVSSQTLKAANSGKGADNFAQTDMLLAMMAALDYDDDNKDKTTTERTAEKLNDLIGNLSAKGSGSHRGFVWDYYVPYFQEMKRKDYVPVFAYLIRSAQSEEPDVQQWLLAHTVQVEVFQEWSKTYQWPK
ncbi:tetratricopeptide repeat protein [Hymenobacter sp. 15J16-1T3B]|uniref:tetratricopeptide repeat protein n=1 Tax=Hymenobacter sp. 15J16-1T3B TaxID=2886941 RepID=UPI001D102D2B|nr:tetratricopeptide repeat protein [Hymenobacter sp. 15J16-1T3B]MCC3159636.1 tetratricopeptide repeat protein [Hymenobacter sp. 15J16-1T3B]